MACGWWGWIQEELWGGEVWVALNTLYEILDEYIKCYIFKRLFSFLFKRLEDTPAGMVVNAYNPNVLEIEAHELETSLSE